MTTLKKILLCAVTGCMVGAMVGCDVDVDRSPHASIFTTTHIPTAIAIYARLFMSPIATTTAIMYAEGHVDVRLIASR